MLVTPPPLNDGLFNNPASKLTSSAWRNWFDSIVNYVKVYTGIASVGANSPVQSSGGPNPIISMPAATNSAAGYLTSTDHANIPSSGQKAALSGTNGTPSGTDKYVTDSDPRNTNSRQANGRETIISSTPYNVVLTDECLVVGALSCTLQVPTPVIYGNRSFEIQTNYGAINYALTIKQGASTLFYIIGPVHIRLSSDGVSLWSAFLYEHRKQHMSGGYDEILPIDINALAIDGSNANATIDVNSRDIKTTGDMTCTRNHLSGYDRGNGTDRVLVYGGTTMADGAGMEFYSTGIGFNKGNINFISQSGGGAGTGNILFLNTHDGSSFPTIMKIDSTGRIGIGGGTPSAMVDIQAGTAVAGSAPVKFHAGTLLSSLELGTLEFVDNGTTGHLYITLNVAGVLTRLQII